ncbi:MAG: Na(+)-translocating NADH-quinone reductase subunit C [Pseudomonadota bacterium]
MKTNIGKTMNRRFSAQFTNTATQRGFLNLPNDNVIKTIAVATLLCLACSIVVSVTAIALKPKQIENKLVDKKLNILSVAGLSDSTKPVDELFEQIESQVVDLASGEVVTHIDAATYDQRKASKDPDMNVLLTAAQDKARLKTRAKYANVYLLPSDTGIEKIILPVKGYGLWSTMYGFIALDGDANTVSGITFYDHGETPGLGGEIENAKWQQSWAGKKLIDDSGEIALQVIKGAVNPATSSPEYKIDGLTGATLTSNGVDNMIKFWMGADGFGPYLERYRAGNLEQGLIEQGSIDQGSIESSSSAQVAPIQSVINTEQVISSVSDQVST